MAIIFGRRGYRDLIDCSLWSRPTTVSPLKKCNHFRSEVSIDLTDRQMGTGKTLPPSVGGGKITQRVGLDL